MFSNIYEIHAYANSVWRNPEFTEEQQFDRIFSHPVSQAVCRMIPGFDWNDPDTSYQEDVDAFMYEFNSRMRKF